MKVRGAAIVFAAVLGAVIAASGSYSGLDVSDITYENTFQCLLKDGYTFVIVRCWHSNGGPDTNAPHTLANAQAVGMNRTDVYMFPCYSCGNPEEQVQKAVAYLNSYNSSWGMYWLDIEGPGQYWSNSPSANQNFFESLVKEALAQNQTLGIYTSESQWNPIFGASYTGGKDYPLWYAHYEYPYQKNFNDFTPFGGWSKPFMKQYTGTGEVCSQSEDLDWTPYSSPSEWIADVKNSEITL